MPAFSRIIRLMPVPLHIELDTVDSYKKQLIVVHRQLQLKSSCTAEPSDLWRNVYVSKCVCTPQVIRWTGIQRGHTGMSWLELIEISKSPTKAITDVYSTPWSKSIRILRARINGTHWINLDRRTHASQMKIFRILGVIIMLNCSQQNQS